MTTAADVEAALAKLRSARYQLYLFGQQRDDAVLTQARHTDTIQTINGKIAQARQDVLAATDEVLLAMAEEDPPPGP